MMVVRRQAPRHQAPQRHEEDDNHDDDDLELLEFAKDALAKAAILAAEVAARKKVCAAGCLAANLWIAKSALDSAGANQLPKRQRRLPKLLDDLEYVCSWPKLPNPHVSILEAMVRPPPHRKALQLQQQAEEHARQGIFAFAKAPESIRDQYLKKLDRFAKPIIAADEEDEARGRVRKSAAEDETPDDYPPHVNANLYAVLKSHSPCTCTWAGGHGRHHARLRLRENIVKVNGCVAFDMLFSASPTGSGEWQDMQMRVSMRKKAKKTVRYTTGDEEPMTQGAGESIEPNSADAAERSRLIEPQSFCRLVKTRLGSRICCRIQDEELHQLYDGFPLAQQIGPGSGMSLRKVLELSKLSNRMKLVLAYIVARSFWQFYDSPWMEAQWSSDSIQFLPESPVEEDDDSVSDAGSDATESNGALFASRPYFAVDFTDQGTEGPVEYCDSYSVVYRYPRLLALCTMLLEIARGRALDFEDEGTMEANLNASWTLARRHAKRTRSWKDFNYPDYKNAVLGCLNYKPEDNDDNTNDNGQTRAVASTTESDVFARKAAIYSKVVQPLEKLLKALGFADNLHIVDPIDMSRHPDRAPELPAPPPVASLTSQQGQGNSNAQAATQWLDSISSINAAIRERARGRKAAGRHRPVRIAVLDTGYDGEAVFFSNPARQHRIKGWKDFSEGCEAAVDSNGHGTHTLALVMKVAPSADMYVARIAKDRAGLQNAAETVAQAIRWAAEESSVDIIAMAFGFPEEMPVITRAILEAQLNRNNKLIFLAAASNSGANRREAFPATLDTVISVYETNHLGAFSDTNPPVDPRGPIVFGTVGRDVPSAWLSSVAGEVPKSGSSVATGVAAGIVALILEFVSVGLKDTEARLPGEIDRVWTRQGMISVLTRMSHDMGNRSFFISPISFFSGKDLVRSWTAISDAVLG